MKIAILSDIHDHIDQLSKALEDIKEDCDAIVFCGDMVSPFTTGLLAKANLPTFACLGNNDEDQIGMMKKGSAFTWFHLSREFGEAEFEGKKVAFCHYPKLAELLAKSGEYDAVFFGHTHESRNEEVSSTLLLNPGSICGINFSTAKYESGSYAIYDTSTNSAKIVYIK